MSLRRAAVEPRGSIACAGPVAMRRGLGTVLIAACVATVPPARAQAPFPVPIPGEVFLLPLLLLALPLAHEWSKSDRDRLRELQSRQDWDRVAALAERELAARPGDARWLDVRGRARMAQGRWDEAVADLRAAFDAMADAGIDVERRRAVGLALALGESLAGDAEAARKTLGRLRALDPDGTVWHPWYQLGVLAARRGDTAALAEALVALRPLRPQAAQRLQSDAEAATSDPSGWPTGPAPGTRLAIGPHAVQLPGEGWTPGPDAPVQHVRGGLRQILQTSQAALHTRSAYAASGGRLHAAAVFSANALQAYGVSSWDVPDPCAGEGPSLLHRSRFDAGFDHPECLLVRRVGGADAPAAVLAPVLAAATAAGAAPPPRAHEIVYARYGLDWTVSLTLLLPVAQLPGDLAVSAWALALATALRPLAQDGAPREAALPPLRPLR